MPWQTGLRPAGLFAMSLALAACSTGPSQPPTPIETAEPVLCECLLQGSDAASELTMAVSAPEPEPIPQVGRLLTIGQIEYVVLGDNLLQQRARIDTGATTSSIGAQDISLFERDGEPWARFLVRSRDTDESVSLEAPLTRRVSIKTHSGAADDRLAVNLPLTVGPLRQVVEVTLTNRDQFDYPVLVGRNFLEGRVVVDVSREYIAMDQESPE
ncbi:MAG: ATP-dependent zinc protease [Pseudomonadota bacterium]